MQEKEGAVEVKSGGTEGQLSADSSTDMSHGQEKSILHVVTMPEGGEVDAAQVARPAAAKEESDGFEKSRGHEVQDYGKAVEEVKSRGKVSAGGLPLANPVDGADPNSVLRNEVIELLFPLTKEQIMGLLAEACVAHVSVLNSVRELTEKDTSHRKLFIRGLPWKVTSKILCDRFASFGELEEGAVIFDRVSGKSAPPQSFSIRAEVAV